jgi:hypothetical protein
MIEAPHIGNILKDFAKRNRIFQSAWARDAGLTPQTVANYLKQPSLRVDTLFAICQQLNYNFLADIAALLPALPHKNSAMPNIELEAMQKENESLKIQIATLKEAIGLMGKAKL